MFASDLENCAILKNPFDKDVISHTCALAKVVFLIYILKIYLGCIYFNFINLFHFVSKEGPSNLYTYQYFELCQMLNLDIPEKYNTAL